MAIEPIYKDFIAKYLGNSFLSSPPDNSSLRTYICYDTTRKALIDLLGDQITEHEVITFLRYFSTTKCLKQTKSTDRHTIQALVQMDLKRHLWNDIDRLKEYLYNIDPENANGFILPSKIHTVISGCRLPIRSVSIDDMLAVYDIFFESVKLKTNTYKESFSFHSD